MGPASAKSHRGQEVVRAEASDDEHGTQTPAARATQEIDYGRRGKGYSFGAFRPATGDAYTRPDAGRTIANGVDVLVHVDGWVPAEIERIDALVDNLNVHRATDVVRFALHHPRWEFVCQPKDAAYLNLIEPWWKVLRSLALKGRRFERWDEVCAAVEAATASWNKHKHPFVWGRRRRHRVKRSPGIAAAPSVR
jgi:hypothetical protein